MESDSETKGAGRTGSRNRSRERDSNYSVSDRRASSYSGRGGDGGRNRGGTVSSRGPDSPAGQNRRQSAVSSFTSSVKGAMKGLANSLGFNSPTADPNADPNAKARQQFNRQIDDALGINTVQDINTGWSLPDQVANPDNFTQFSSVSPYASPRDLEMREQEIGARKSVHAEMVSTAPKVGGLLTMGADYFSNSLSDPAKEAYDDVQKQTLGTFGGTAARQGIGFGLTRYMQSPVADPISNVIVGGINTKLAADYAGERYGVEFKQPQQRRREDALRAFGGKKPSLIGENLLSSQQPYSVWEPASYGVGNYGSHVRGLLKS